MEHGWGKKARGEEHRVHIGFKGAVHSKFRPFFFLSELHGLGDFRCGDTVGTKRHFKAHKKTFPMSWPGYITKSTDLVVKEELFSFFP